MDPIQIAVLKVDQPIGEFYIGSLDARQLISISYTEIRKFVEGRQEDLAGIQRERSPKRINELAQYVNFDYATFPTSVVLAVDERSVSVSPVDNCGGLYLMEISEFEGDDETPSIPLDQSAFIIDGQHRLAGLEHLNDGKTFEINVSIFVGADLADKAEIFSRNISFKPSMMQMIRFPCSR
jgi:DGQHR domain-containing protein